jgi:hypothetical protein
MLACYEEALSARHVVTNLSPRGSVTLEIWLRGRDLNPRPLGYEPNELPDCSTPRQEKLIVASDNTAVKPDDNTTMKRRDFLSLGVTAAALTPLARANATQPSSDMGCSSRPRQCRAIAGTHRPTLRNQRVAESGSARIAAATLASTSLDAPVTGKTRTDSSASRYHLIHAA